MGTIYFYKVNEDYGCFSNFSPHPFVLEGEHWPTSEHYFQAQKFFSTTLEYAEQIRLALSPMKAANMGRSRKYPIRSDWEEQKDIVMKKAVLAKFQTHKDIRDILISSGDSLLVEKTTSDFYWGCGKDGTGLNKLGLILMEIRAKLK
jgi:ribA/ribD-fused uncharacterized protein